MTRQAHAPIPKTILILEGHYLNMKLINDLLQARGYHTDRRGTGQKAWRWRAATGRT